MIRPGNVEDFAATIERRFGHLPDGSRQAELARTLEKRMLATRSATYAEYRAALDRSPEEWSALAPLLTVPETYFFRLPDQFEALAGAAIPAMLRMRQAERSLRILSAGCASGEEAYSIRILLNERFHQLRAGAPEGWTVTIDGFDLSAQALDRARTAEYSEWSLRATSARRRRDNFIHIEAQNDSGQRTAASGQGQPGFKAQAVLRQGGLYRLLPHARSTVSFFQANLLQEPAQPLYDVIFCRNVLIYFTERAISQAIARLTQRLAPGGYLFLGPAESLRGLSRDFTLAQTHDVFYYRLRDQVHGPPSKMVATRAARLEEVLSTPAADCEVERPAQEAERSTQAAERSTQADTTWYDSINALGTRLNRIIRPVTSVTSSAAQMAAAEARSARRVSVAQPPRKPAAPMTAAASGPAPPPQQAREPFFKLVRAERFAEALAWLDSIARAASGDDLRLLRAAMLVHLERYDEADRECTLLLEAGGPNPGAHYLAGLCRDHQGQAAEAEQHMTQASYLDPGFVLPLLLRGQLAKRRADAAAAKAAYQRALAALDHEDDTRLTLFAGAVSRAGLRQVCVAELARLGGA